MSPSGTRSLSRRRFLGRSTAGVALFHFASFHLFGQDAPSNKLNIAAVGVGGRGAANVSGVSSENIVALCDVDSTRAAATFKKLPGAKRYTDYREMLEKEAKQIDAVVIATPDHLHAPVAMMAMRLKKHVYVEKPMAHTIEECREMTRLAREMKVVTQMGNQGHSGEGLRLTAEYLQAGAIGAVREVHGWSNRPTWPQGIDRPTDTPPVPETLNWDLWLGPAPVRPYSTAYVPFKWRGWWDFGCGAMGDMAVHNVDPAFFCLKLGAPTAAEAETSPVNQETFPAWQILTYHFPSRPGFPAIALKWYDGKKKPAAPPGLDADEKLGENGIIFIGEKGSIICPSHAGNPRILPDKLMDEFPRPAKTLKRSIGHHKEWIQACKDNQPEDAWAGFAYSGPFTEALLVGNLAVRLGRRIEWDAARMKATNAPEADRLIRKQYRKGFGIA